MVALPTHRGGGSTNGATAVSVDGMITAGYVTTDELHALPARGNRSLHADHLLVAHLPCFWHPSLKSLCRIEDLFKPSRGAPPIRPAPRPPEHAQRRPGHLQSTLARWAGRRLVSRRAAPAPPDRGALRGWPLGAAPLSRKAAALQSDIAISGAGCGPERRSGPRGAARGTHPCRSKKSSSSVPAPQG